MSADSDFKARGQALVSRVSRWWAILFLVVGIGACGENSSPPKAGLNEISARYSLTTAALPATSQVVVVSLERILEARVGRNTYDYTFRVGFQNVGSTSSTGLTAQVIGAGPGTTIIDGVAVVGDIAPGATVNSQDYIVLRHDRSQPFVPAALVWKVGASIVTRIEDLKPAEIYVLPLADINAPSGANSATPAGGVIEALVKEGTLRIATGEDTGADQPAQILVSDGTSSVVVHTLVRSARSSQPRPQIEAKEDGSAPAESLPSLEVTGLGPGNALGANAVKFRLPGAPALDLHSSNGFIAGAGNAVVGLKPYWTYSQADSSFSISAQGMTQVLAALPGGSLRVNLSFVSPDGEFAANYEFLALKPTATIAGKFVTPSGAAVTVLGGRKVLVRGFNSDVRRVATVGSNGLFSVPGVIPDTYQITLLDLEAPNSVVASVPVFTGSTTVNATLVYGTSQPLTTSSAAGTPPEAESPFRGASVTQDGQPPRRTLPESAAAAVEPSIAPQSTAPNCAAPKPGGGSTVFTATAGAQGDTVTCPISFVVPAGTQRVGVKVTVTTAEYPSYTSQQSQYNDTWSYSVNGLPGLSFSGAGSVNQSHYTQGTISRTGCADVTAQAASSPITVTGQASAANVGDGALPTTAVVTLSLSCTDGGLIRVSEAKFTSPSGTNPILDPINLQGNNAGPFISVSPTSAISSYRIPLEIRFEPPNAQITEVNIGFAASGSSTPTFSTDNLLAQPRTIAGGKITFPGISMPVLVGSRVNGRLGFFVRLTGTVNGQAGSSDPAEGGQISFKQKTAFIPLYLAGDEPNLSTRRYGSRDAGGDSWATAATIAWLGGNAFRFDDISATHIAQTPAGGSVLGHSGHSDGQQIDFRYADGQGGYTDALGGQGSGASIKQMLDAAAVEVAANAAQKPNLAKAVAWINANRALITGQAGAATARKLYFGNSWMKRALVDAKFPNGTAIPGLSTTPWTIPTKASPASNHLHHWHLSINAAP